jgi:hypothetical protein
MNLSDSLTNSINPMNSNPNVRQVRFLNPQQPPPPPQKTPNTSPVRISNTDAASNSTPQQSGRLFQENPNPFDDDDDDHHHRHNDDRNDRILKSTSRRIWSAGDNPYHQDAIGSLRYPIGDYPINKKRDEENDSDEWVGEVASISKGRAKKRHRQYNQEGNEEDNNYDDDDDDVPRGSWSLGYSQIPLLASTNPHSNRTNEKFGHSFSNYWSDMRFRNYYTTNTKQRLEKKRTRSKQRQQYMGPNINSGGGGDEDGMEESFLQGGADIWAPSQALRFSEPLRKHYKLKKMDSLGHNLHLRRELMVYLTKIETPIFQFVEILNAAMGLEYNEKDFIFVFPHDTLELSTKDPRLSKKQSYTVEDFVQELLKVYATHVGSHDWHALTKLLWNFMSNSHARKNGDALPLIKRALPNTTYKHANKGGGGADHEPADGTFVETHPDEWTEKDDEDFDPEKYSDSEAKKLDEDDEGNSVLFLWRSFFEKWMTGNYFRDIMEKSGGKDNEEDDNFDGKEMGFLILKPIVRGMIRMARAEINTEAGKSFGVHELMYSPEVSSHFAKYIALQQRSNGRSNGAGGSGGGGFTMPSPNYSGNLYIINKAPSRYNLDDYNVNKHAAIAYWKRVYRNPALGYLVFDKNYNINNTKYSSGGGGRGVNHNRVADESWSWLSSSRRPTNRGSPDLLDFS